MENPPGWRVINVIRVFYLRGRSSLMFFWIFGPVCVGWPRICTRAKQNSVLAVAGQSFHAGQVDCTADFIVATSMP